MVQDDSHPVANRKGYENGSGYERQGGHKQAIDAMGSTQPQGYGRQGNPSQSTPIIGYVHPPSSQRHGSSISKPISTQTQGEIGSASIGHGPSHTLIPSSQRQGNQPQSFVSKPISTQQQEEIGRPSIHHGPSPTQVRENQSHNSSIVNDGRSGYNDHEGARNQLHLSSYSVPTPTPTPAPAPATTKPHAAASANGNESSRKPYDDSAHYQPPVNPGRRTQPQVSSMEDGHDSDHHDWKGDAKREPKNVPSNALQLDHFNGGKEPYKLQTENEKSSASPQDRHNIQVNVNVYYDKDGKYTVDSAPPQATPPRQAPALVPVPARTSAPIPAPVPSRTPAPASAPVSVPARQADARLPPPKPSSCGCCSIL